MNLGFENLRFFSPFFHFFSSLLIFVLPGKSDRRQVQNTTSCHNSGTMNLDSIRIISTVRGHAPYKYPPRNTIQKRQGTTSNPIWISRSNTSFSDIIITVSFLWTYFWDRRLLHRQTIVNWHTKTKSIVYWHKLSPSWVTVSRQNKSARLTSSKSLFVSSVLLMMWKMFINNRKS